MPKFLFFLLTITVTKSFCQNNVSFDKAKVQQIDFPSKSYHGDEKIPFSEIIITDYRFDTTKIGYMRNYDFYKIVFPQTSSIYLTRVINDYLRKNLTPGADSKLTIIIKSLWINNFIHDTSENGGGKIRQPINQGTNDKAGSCTADFEIFATQGPHNKALAKIKYEFPYSPYTYDKFWDMIYLPFDSMVRHIGSMNMEATLQKRKDFSRAEIDSAYKSRYEIPVLKTSFLRKGVFFTFDEFKENKPSLQDFEIRSSELTDELYVKNKKDDELLINYWGYCDGKDYYIHAGLNCFKLVRQNNTWDFYGTPFVTIINRLDNLTTVVGGFYLRTRGTKLQRKTLQINMETGDVY